MTLSIRLLTLVLVSAACLSCTPPPGYMNVTFHWEDGPPKEPVWLFGKVVKVTAETGAQGQIISELAGSQKYEAGMALQFSDVPNEDGLVILIEARADSSLESRVLFYGKSNAFSLAPGVDEVVEVPVPMMSAPALLGLQIANAVGPNDCPQCYISTNYADLSLQVNRGTAVEVANDTEFTQCNKTLALGEKSAGMTLLANGDHWQVMGWDFDCELGDLADGPRSVYVRVLDGEGYPSQTISAQVVLDRQPPTKGTLICAEGTWLIDLRTIILFGVLDASEMWVEACQPEPGDAICTTIPGGLLPCSTEHEHFSATEQWTELTTQGCVRLADESIENLRVKYRDLAQNETAWVNYSFENVTELTLGWVAIPGGTFMMGCSPGDSACHVDEEPAHLVTLSSFEMIETEVTEEQYKAATGEEPSCDWGSGGGPDSPVECIRRFDALKFCQKVGGRLPTEAEWEYAARGGTATKHYCGDDADCVGDIAWYEPNSKGHKHDVKGKLPNAYGLYDMLGNVFEWTADWYDEEYYSISPLVDPTGPHVGTVRNSRGGGFNHTYDTLRVSIRGIVEPSGSYMDVGIRCVR
jgi:formylglycine-generating enzyme